MKEKNMADVKFVRDITGILVIDPYNDFISEGGKFWPRLKAVAEANNCVPNMLQVLNAARAAKLLVFYPLHRRYRPGDYEVTMVRNATADYSELEMHAALDVNIPNYAAAIVTTKGNCRVDRYALKSEC